MNKYLLIILVTAIFFSLSPFLNSAEAQITIEPPTGHKTFGDLIDAIVDFIFNIALVVAPLMIIIGGFYFVTATGDPGKVQTAKNIIWYTIIGFAIVLLAKGFATILTGLLKGP